jgi:cytosine/adenosine deaminase-related metal-dependent hydrolase
MSRNTGSLDRRQILALAATAATLGPARAQAPARSEAADRSRPILIRGGSVLTMDPGLGDLREGNVLVQNGRIADVGAGLAAPDGALVIEAAGGIVVPGSVNGHIHLGQALFRGLSGDHTIGQYFRNVVAKLSGSMSPEDLYLSDYAGALEQIAAGTTTVFDWSREARSSAHADAAIDAMQRSGIRAVFAYGLAGGGADAKQTANSPPVVADDIRRLRRDRLTSDDTRVRLALAIRGPDFSSMAETESDLALARELGLMSQFHAGALHYAGRQKRAVLALAEKKLLGPDVNIAHANDFDADEFKAAADHGAAIVSTPEVEMNMGHGWPAVGRALKAGAKLGLGVDIVVQVAGDMFTQMRTALAAQRLSDHLAAQHGTGKPAERLEITARQILEAATIRGAEAIGLERQIGSIARGKAADLVVLRYDASSGLPVADPVSTVVFQTSPANVDSVLIDGAVVKSGGRLVQADVAALTDQLRQRALAQRP